MFRNPVLTKELRSVMRKKRAFAIAALYVLVLGAFVIYAWPEESEALWGAKVGQNIFRRFSVAQFFLISILAPALTAGSMTVEKEQNTLSLLLSTALRPRQILSGKLLSPLLYCSLLISASIPVTSLCFVLGGVSPREVILVYIVCSIAALLYGSIGLLASVSFRRTLFSMPVAYVLIIAVTVATWKYSLVAQFFSYQSNIAQRQPELLSDIQFLLSGWIFVNLGIALVINALLLKLLKHGYEPGEGNRRRRFFKRPYSHIEDVGQKAKSSRPDPENSHQSSTTSQTSVVKTEPESYATCSTTWLTTNSAEQADEASDAERVSRPIGDRQNPLLVKEIRTRMFGRKVWFIRAVYVSVIFSQCFLIFLTLNVAAFVNATNTIFCTYAMIHLSIVILFSGLINACSITLEREQRTFDLLINTLLKPRSIVLGKLLGTSWYIAMIIVGSIPPTALAILGAIISLRTAVCFIIAQVVYAYTFGVVGILCSLKCRRTTTAIGCIAGIIFALSTPSFLLNAIKRPDNFPKVVNIQKIPNAIAQMISPLHTTANIVTQEVSDGAAAADVIKSIVGTSHNLSPYPISSGYMRGRGFGIVNPFTLSVTAYALITTVLLCLIIRLFPRLCRLATPSHPGLTRAAAILISILFSMNGVLWPERRAYCQDQGKLTSTQSRTVKGLSWEVHAGYNGSFKLRRYAPIIVSIENAGETFDGEIVLELKKAKGKPSRYRKSVHLPAPSKRIYMLYARFDLHFEKAEIELRSADGTLVGERRELKLEPIFGSTYLAVVLNKSPIALDIEPERMTLLRVRSRNVWLEPDYLPDEWVGYDAVDLIIIGDIDPRAIGDGKVKALKEWVAAGGKLMFTVTDNWQSVRGTWLEEILPVKIIGAMPVRSLRSLSKKFKMAADTHLDDLGGEGIIIGDAKVTGGEVIIEQDGVPLLVKRRFGFGLIYYLGFSLDEREIRTWHGISKFWESIYEDRTLQPIIGSANDKLSIATILADVPSLDLPPRWVIGSFIAVFALLLGPINYLLLMRGRRFAFAWITMPAIIACAAAAAYLYGRHIKGEDVLLNEISLAETSANCDIARVTHYSSLFAPRGGVFDLIVNDASATISPLFSNWSGRRFRNVNLRRSKALAPTSKTTTIKGIKVDSSALADKLDQGQGGSIVLRNIEIHYATMRHFQSVSRRNLGGAIKAKLRRLNRQIILKGEIVNGTSLNIEDCFLLDWSSWWYLGDLTQGTRKEINLSRKDGNVGPLHPPWQTVNQEDVKTSRQQAFIARENRRKSDLLILLKAARQSARFGDVRQRVIPSGMRKSKSDEVVLGGWVSHPFLETSVADGKFDRSSLSLFICHIPLMEDVK